LEVQHGQEPFYAEQSKTRPCQLPNKQELSIRFILPLDESNVSPQPSSSLSTTSPFTEGQVVKGMIIESDELVGSWEVDIDSYDRGVCYHCLSLCGGTNCHPSPNYRTDTPRTKSSISTHIKHHHETCSVVLAHKSGTRWGDSDRAKEVLERRELRAEKKMLVLVDPWNKLKKFVCEN
jgi:hypothetical protein